MRNCLWTLASSVLVSLLAGGLALAHEHHDMSHADRQMQKLHAMMPMFATASAELQAALEKKDAAAVDAAAGKITSAIPDLKKSKPHKYAAQRKKYVKLAGRLGDQANAVTEQAKKGDFSAAGKTFADLKKTCDGCHATYRD